MLSGEQFGEAASQRRKQNHAIIRAVRQQRVRQEGEGSRAIKACKKCEGRNQGNGRRNSKGELTALNLLRLSKEP